MKDIGVKVLITNLGGGGGAEIRVMKQTKKQKQLWLATQELITTQLKKPRLVALPGGGGYHWKIYEKSPKSTLLLRRVNGSC